jgi:hypothetical protein
MSTDCWGGFNEIVSGLYSVDDGQYLLEKLEKVEAFMVRTSCWCCRREEEMQRAEGKYLCSTKTLEPKCKRQGQYSIENLIKAIEQ